MIVIGDVKLRKSVVNPKLLIVLENGDNPILHFRNDAEYIYTSRPRIGVGSCYDYIIEVDSI